MIPPPKKSICYFRVYCRYVQLTRVKKELCTYVVIGDPRTRDCHHSLVPNHGIRLAFLLLNVLSSSVLLHTLIIRKLKKLQILHMLRIGKCRFLKLEGIGDTECLRVIKQIEKAPYESFLILFSISCNSLYYS